MKPFLSEVLSFWLTEWSSRAPKLGIEQSIFEKKIFVKILQASMDKTIAGAGIRKTSKIIHICGNNNRTFGPLKHICGYSAFLFEWHNALLIFFSWE